MNLSRLILLCCLLSLACTPTSDPEPEVPEDPQAALLVFPEDNTECNEGIILSDTQSRVTFRWNAAEQAESYIVILRHVNTGSSQEIPADSNETEITLERGAPYEWHVISESTKTDVTATSETWKFYNAGLGISNYAPFPATAVSPESGTVVTNTTSVLLQWQGADIDDDISQYEVFFSTENPPQETLGTFLTQETNANIAVGETYYWYVVSHDEAGNSSESDVFNFSTE